MAYRALVRADSISERGHRLTTLEVDMPRIILAEYNTHRDKSRNSASSRAIPVKKQLKRVMADPFVPDVYGRNQSGMNPDLDRPLTEIEIAQADKIWLSSRDAAVEHAMKLLLGERAFGGFTRDVTGKAWSRTPKRERFDSLCQTIDALPNDLTDEFEVQEKLGLSVEELLNIHKQYPNRLLEPYMWHTMITSATEWSNYFGLRTDSNAQREIMLASLAMQEAMSSSTPAEIQADNWHLPLFDRTNPVDAEVYCKSIEEAKLVSVGRCARVSYLTHDGKRDPSKDIELALSLLNNGHMSPFEHVARPMSDDENKRNEFSGNFRGWLQARKEIPNEHDFSSVTAGREVAV